MDSTHDVDDDEASTDSEISGYASHGNNAATSEENEDSDDDSNESMNFNLLSVRRCSTAASRGSTRRAT